MNKLIEQISTIITSLGAVMFVLLMTIVAMIFLSHGLYYQIFIRTMSPWQAEVASWVLACGIETTVLIVTCNVKFVSRYLPLFLAICSGLIVLFFIQAFDTTQSNLDLVMRWFIGVLVASANYIYSELFFKKYTEALYHKDIEFRMNEMTVQHQEQTHELLNTKDELMKSKNDIEKLLDYVSELESFKNKEVERLTCPYCNTIQSSVYKLASHKGVCQFNPKKELKQSIYEEVV